MMMHSVIPMTMLMVNESIKNLICLILSARY
jgi:hypothetical protein